MADRKIRGHLRRKDSPQVNVDDACNRNDFDLKLTLYGRHVINVHFSIQLVLCPMLSIYARADWITDETKIQINWCCIISVALFYLVIRCGFKSRVCAGDLREHPLRKCAPIVIRIKSQAQRPVNDGGCTQRRWQMSLAKCKWNAAAKSRRWLSGRRNGIWVAGRFVFLSFFLPIFLSPIFHVSLATGLRFPINGRVPLHDPHHRALSTVMVFRS